MNKVNYLSHACGELQSDVCE